MLKIRYFSRFKKDYKLMQKRGYDLEKLKTAVRMLCNAESLPEKYKDHLLSGNYAGFRECHIEPDWLLIYKVEEEIITLTLTRTGTHSDLFK